jgi:mRNA-degrading endonuclease RelE of RelBE toxin-antitoxin system
MEWNISLSRQAEKFLSKNHLSDQFVLVPVGKAIKKLFGAAVSIDIKRLSGEWFGCYCIRSGKIRIIFNFEADERRVFVEAVDYRGNVYD